MGTTIINRLGWVVVTAVLVSAFWIFSYNIGLARRRTTR